MTLEDTQSHKQDVERVLHAFADHGDKDDTRFANIESKLSAIDIKVDEMHKIFMQGKAITSMAGGIGDFGKWVLIIAAAVVVIKAWGAGTIAWFLTKN